MNEFTGKIGTSPKIAAASAIVVANAFIWYLYSGRFLNDVTGTVLSDAVRAANVVGAAAAAIIGVHIIYRVRKRLSFLRYWMLAGVFLSLVPLLVDVTQVGEALVFFTIVGMYFGIGMPACFAYFSASTDPSNRSKLGGLIFFVTFLIVFSLGFFPINDLAGSALILATCKALGLTLIITIRPHENEIAVTSAKYDVSYGSILRSRPFILYFIPWLIFSVMNYMAVPVVSGLQTQEVFHLSSTIENLLAGVFVLVFGVVADRVGRKRLVVAGFALLGLAYASLGLFQGNLAGWWFYTAADGIAWGLFYTIYIMTIWGDLAQGRNSEKYYALGFMPFLFAPMMETFGNYLSASNMVSPVAVFSFASVFLFLAVLPLAYAPETLNLKEKEFKSYIDKAVRAKVKFEASK